MSDIITTVQTVHDLRHRWKPHKERLHAAGGDQPTAIRFHRACSWMARVEAMPEDQDHDLGSDLSPAGSLFHNPTNGPCPKPNDSRTK
jgi:hypothetical protein